MKIRVMVWFMIVQGIFLSSLIAQRKAEINLPTASDHGFLYGIRKIYQPPWFQGANRKHPYFEGWYFKMVSGDGNHIWAVIPGISLTEDGKDNHSFIQIIDGNTAKTWYFRFPAQDFHFSKHHFTVQIQDNYFSADSLSINLKDETDSFKAQLSMRDPIRFPATFFRPGVMGWYRYVPGMECYHGLVSANHSVNGFWEKNGANTRWENGKGYIEKDWGTSFPSAYVWMQSNHFENRPASFMLSVANIPWKKKHFRGFLGIFWANGKKYRFATYTGAKLDSIAFLPDGVKLSLHDGPLTLSVLATRQKAGELRAPDAGKMDRRIAESVDATLEIQLSHRKKGILFEGKGIHAGLETVGNLAELLGE